MRIPVKFPRKAQSLFVPAPIKVLHGGRGSSKSWDIAQALLILGAHTKLFIVCAREVQKSIKDSGHKLLSDQIVRLGFHAHRRVDGSEVAAFYDVLDTEIRGVNGTTFSFIGLNNINSVRSMEGIDILWVTEAVHVPRSKWDILMPTVRRDAPYGPFKQGSEIWIDFNPELTSDDTYMMFVVDPPAGALVIEINYQDNPFFPATLRKQMEEMRAKDFDNYRTVWEGKTRKVLQGAIFANELGLAIQDGRVGPHIKYDPKRPCTASFDLGDADMTSMWVWQQVGNQHIAVFYMEENGQDIVYFLRELQERKFLMRGIWLPHDARQQHQAARRLALNTIEKQARAVYPSPGVVKVVPNISIPIQINAARALFPRMCMNDVECSRGIMCLQHYQFEVDQVTKERSKKPLHNWASHGASAFMQYCVQLREGTERERQADLEAESGEVTPGRSSKFSSGHSQSWMG
jgi:phage terminase large subunit